MYVLWMASFQWVPIYMIFNSCHIHVHSQCNMHVACCFKTLLIINNCLISLKCSNDGNNTSLFISSTNIVAAFWGVHVSPAKNSYAWLYQESVTTGQTHGQTDRHRTKWSLCAAMLCRQHKNSVMVSAWPWEWQSMTLSNRTSKLPISEVGSLPWHWQQMG